MTAGAKRVLLVDDDPALLQVLAIRLRRAGFEVETAESARQALSLLSGFWPQVVVTDMRMDGMDGLALFDEIQKIDATLPVIVLTAHGTIPDAVTATRRGVFSYLTKPFEKEVLLDAISRAAEIHGEPAPAGGEQGADWASEIVTRSTAIDRKSVV